MVEESYQESTQTNLGRSPKRPDGKSVKFVCPMCRVNKHDLCSPSFCDCQHRDKVS
jgi:hypothetical protein